MSVISSLRVYLIREGEPVRPSMTGSVKNPRMRCPYCEEDEVPPVIGARCQECHAVVVRVSVSTIEEALELGEFLGRLTMAAAKKMDAREAEARARIDNVRALSAAADIDSRLQEIVGEFNEGREP